MVRLINAGPSTVIIGQVFTALLTTLKNISLIEVEEILYDPCNEYFTLCRL